MDLLQENRKKEESKKTIRVLVMALYLICLVNTAGIPLNPSLAGEPLKGAQAEKAGEENTAVQETAAGIPGDEKDADTVQETPAEKKKIALTFDDGPSGCTGRLLNGLRKRNVKATFFVLGQKVEENLELTKKISEDGHQIGNHTYSHAKLDTLSIAEAKRELEKTSHAIFKATGKFPEYMRPPYGVCPEKLEDSVDMILVRWSVDPQDWNTQNADEIVRKVVTKAEENDIILLHDCYDSSVDAALGIVDALKEENFEFVTVDELYLN